MTTVLQDLEKIAERAPQPAIRHSILQTAHVLRYPMKDILDKVPGETLTERAEKIGVSRQTMYVWQHERFRPGLDQATIISNLTGVPVWQIRDLQVNDGEVDKGMAKDRRSVPGRPKRLRAARGRMVSKRGGG